MRKRKVTITVETHRRVVIQRIGGRPAPDGAPARTEPAADAAREEALARKEKRYE